MNTYSIILLIIFIVLQILDGWTTVLFLRNPNLREWFKPLKCTMERIGVIPALIVFKTAITMTAIFALWYFPYWQIQVTIGVGCAIYVFVVARNYTKL